MWLWFAYSGADVGVQSNTATLTITFYCVLLGRTQSELSDRTRSFHIWKSWQWHTSIVLQCWSLFPRSHTLPSPDSLLSILIRTSSIIAGRIQVAGQGFQQDGSQHPALQARPSRASLAGGTCTSRPRTVPRGFPPSGPAWAASSHRSRQRRMERTGSQTGLLRLTRPHSHAHCCPRRQDVTSTPRWHGFQAHPTRLHHQLQVLIPIRHLCRVPPLPT